MGRAVGRAVQRGRDDGEGSAPIRGWGEGEHGFGGGWVWGVEEGVLCLFWCGLCRVLRVAVGGRVAVLQERLRVVNRSFLLRGVGVAGEKASGVGAEGRVRALSWSVSRFAWGG